MPELGSGIECMLAKGFAVNGAAVVLIDTYEDSLRSAMDESEEASKNIGVEVQVTTFVLSILIAFCFKTNSTLS